MSEDQPRKNSQRIKRVSKSAHAHKKNSKKPRVPKSTIPDKEQSGTERELLQENEALRRQAVDAQSAQELRQILLMGMATGIVAAPVSHSQLLEQAVQTAAHVIGSEAAALFTLDEQSRELIFEIILAGSGPQIRKTRLPIGKGIAGLVAASGQPMIVSDASKDNRVAAGIGYKPRNILCVPLMYNERLTGVLGLYDKIGEKTFSLDDMETLSQFANMAALALELSRARESAAAMIGELLESVENVSEQEKLRLRQQAHSFAKPIDIGGEHQEKLEFARLVQSIVWQGEKEFRACRALLQGFAEYLSK